MSASGTKRTSRLGLTMSGRSGKADLATERPDLQDPVENDRLRHRAMATCVSNKPKQLWLAQSPVRS
jgi:hypothetical protein